MSPAVSIIAADYAQDHARLHALRTTVFIDEQQVPATLERDALDPLSFHVMALDADGRLLGTARLTGQTLGAILLAAIFGVWPPSSGQGEMWAMWLAAGFAALAALSSTLRLRTSKD